MVRGIAQEQCVMRSYLKLVLETACIQFGERGDSELLSQVYKARF